MSRVPSFHLTPQHNGASIRVDDKYPLSIEVSAASRQVTDHTVPWLSCILPESHTSGQCEIELQQKK